MANIDFGTEVQTIRGEDITMETYKGKVLLIVNTASKCGFTPQFAGLEDLYQQYKDEDFVVLGFPCNQFGAQDPGSNDEIAEFCQLNYGVSFPMHAKVEVNGPGTHYLYAQLKEAQPGDGDGEIKWNFGKFLVGKDGEVVKRFAVNVKPSEISDDIEALL